MANKCKKNMETGMILTEKGLGFPKTCANGGGRGETSEEAVAGSAQITQDRTHPLLGGVLGLSK